MSSEIETETKMSPETVVFLATLPDLSVLSNGLQTNPLPPKRSRDPNVPHAPNRTPNLNKEQEKQALRNALRYFPKETHKELAPEFLEELRTYGHIYMYRFLPDFPIRAYPIDQYPSKIQHAAAIMHMIMNNLDPQVAQFPEELVTYGGNGQVFSNWAQFWLVMHYLSQMTETQTLVMYSGHPLGLFPSTRNAPRAVVTNGMVIPNYSSRENYDTMFALGVSMYGQMTAGSYCYIGPQGIVHGTTLTILNAGRNYLKLDSLAGKVYLTSGLGGMSGAQAKASTICGCVGVIAEVDGNALKKRFEQGWLEDWTDDIEELISKIKKAKAAKLATSIGYHGNVVTVWERILTEYKNTKNLLVELGSDQTSCHNPFNGGYYPVQLSFEESQTVLAEDPKRFKALVQESLCRQINAINALADVGLFFWDYGNAFLLEAKRAGADVGGDGGSDSTKFRYPSYVQDIMGDIFSLGFGPFRWVCTSGDPRDLETSDKIADKVMQKIIQGGITSASRRQYEDNQRWIREAGKHRLVVGSQARILYSDQLGRMSIARAFNDAVHSGQIRGPIVISRDHHDVSGTDSPFRETSNIYDGSAFTADMAVQNCIGDAARGATWVALHNGGGVGWGEVINGGFGLVLDGTAEAREKAESVLRWDVSNGVARRAWSGNNNANETILKTMETNPSLRVTIPVSADEDLIDSVYN
ncbi:UNVERIFIED_CONTAM: hypothetical protein RMT77_014219 [Armadillidium vulgare]